MVATSNPLIVSSTVLTAHRNGKISLSRLRNKKVRVLNWLLSFDRFNIFLLHFFFLFLSCMDEKRDRKRDKGHSQDTE